MKRGLFALAALKLTLALVLSGCGKNSEEAATAAGQAAVDGLAIEIASLTAEPSFIDWKQDGVDMQLLALRNDNNQIQLAYNTCQTCAGSPYAYFEYAGGCNLKPVSNASVEGNAVVVPAFDMSVPLVPGDNVIRFIRRRAS